MLNLVVRQTLPNEDILVNSDNSKHVNVNL